MKRTVLAPAMLALILAGGMVGVSRAADADGKPDDEGFLRQWLVLAPIPLADGQSGADAVGLEQVPDEAKLHPKENDKVTVGEKELVWTKRESDDALVDFNKIIGQTTENSVAYAVVYVTAEDEMPGLKLKIGSDDEARVYLNGKELLKHTEARAAEKDQDTVEDVTLKKGINTLILKVVNESEEWSACARFTDKDDKPVTGIELGLKPE